MAAEVALAAFSSIVEAAKYLVKKIQQETSYVFKYQSYLDGLNNQVEQLGYTRERVEQPVNHAKQLGDEIYEDVAVWLKSFDDFTEKVVKPINAYEDEAKKRCFKGSCLNLFKRYSLSKKAEKASKEGADLLARGNFPIVSYHPVARDLERKVKQLLFLRERVEKDVEHAERQGEQIFEAVKDWLIRVKDFSDKAVNASEEVDSLLSEGNFTKVSYLPAPDRTKLKNVKDYEQFDSRMKVFQQVMEALKDNKFNIIGVYGMGGVGKTTLVKQVAKQVVEDKLFDEVVMAEVTQTPDHMSIQNKFAYDLGMKFDLNENVHNRAERLRERLKKEKRVLIVLDNIWKKIEFEEVGIPFENDEKERRCIIILTSRRQDLLSNQMNSRMNFSIEVLSKNEAWQLFEKIVGDSAKQSDFQPTAVEIVERCGGLPVALSTVANALKNKELAIWKDALKQLRSSNRREIAEMDANVYSSIELSYNFLESNEAKSLFLLCGQFSEGHPIQVRWLIRHGMGLGLFENVYTLEEGRNRVHRLIDTLKTSCLLLDGEDDDEVKMHDIIHVVAVLIAAEKHMFNITNAAKLKKEIEKIKQKGPTTISLSCKEDVYELPELLECPQLKLLLFTKGDSSGPIIPDLFFEGMKELEVLHLDDIRCVPSLPSSLGCLINLKTLCLDKCELEDIAIVGQLKNLEILSFRDSDIEKLPLEIGQLTGLQLLDLSNCRWLDVIASNVISRLSRLEELYIDSFTDWEEVEGGENASLVELKGLSKLTSLEICIPDAEIIPQDLVSVELERYRIRIGDTDDSYDEYKSSRLMVFSGPEESILLGIHKMKIQLKRTEHLFLSELEGLHNVVHELDDKEGFPLLKHLYIEECSEILHIVSLIGLAHYQVFPLLESLFLDNLIKLENICQGQLKDDQSFRNLKNIKVENCVKLKHLFLLSMTKNLLFLQKVEVSYCTNLETIFGPDMEKPKTLGIKEIIAEDDHHEKVIFPNLKKLKLRVLPKLTSFAVGINSVEFPSLLKLVIIGCSNLRRFISTNSYEDNTQSLFNEKVGLSSLEVFSLGDMHNLGQIWQTSDYLNKLKKLTISGCNKLISIFQPMVALPNLMNLDVSRCNGLRSLMTLSTAESMVNLTTMKIADCKKLEEIIQEEQVEEEKDRMVFSKLQYLSLYHLSSLTCFCFGKLYTLEFSSLDEVYVSRCPNMKTFSQGKLRTPKLHEVKMSAYISRRLGVDNKYDWEGNLNSTIQRMFKEMVGFNNIGHLELSLFPSLREIWHGQELPVSLFDNLTYLVVDDCIDMSSAISMHLLRCLNNLRTLHICNCDSLEEVFHLEELNDDEHFWPIFRTLEVLKLSNLPKLQRFCNFIGNIIELHPLNHLRIENCPNMEAFISNSASVPMIANKEPQQTTSENFLLLDIQPFFDRNKVLFPCLTVLKLSRLPKLLHPRSAISMHLLRCLNNLKSLEICNCDSLEEVFHLEELNADEYFWSIFPKLKKLKLINLPKLQRFCNFIGNIIELHALLYLRIENCPNMEAFISNSTSVPMIANKEPREMTSEENFLLLDIQPFFDENKVLFPCLTVLKLSRLPKLLHLWREVFENLTTLQISECDKLEKIIQEVGEEVKKECIVFMKLKYLGLDCLSSLTSFCLGNYTIEFPSLKRVVVKECPNMKTFSQGAVDTPKLHKLQVKGKEEEKKEEEEDEDYDLFWYKRFLEVDDDDDDEGRWEGDLNSTIQQLFKEVVHI